MVNENQVGLLRVHSAEDAASYFEHYESTGILKPGTSPEDGVYNSIEDPSQHAGIGAGLLPPAAQEVQKLVESHILPDYLRFLEHPALRQMVRDIMAWEKEILLRRTMLRHNIPNGLSTGVHYDKLFLRDGGAYFLTAWVPIGTFAPETCPRPHKVPISISFRLSQT